MKKSRAKKRLWIRPQPSTKMLMIFICLSRHFLASIVIFLEIKEMNITKTDVTIFSLLLVLKIHKFILKLSYIMFMFLSLQLNIFLFIYLFFLVH
jgi:hypothetical protein